MTKKMLVMLILVLCLSVQQVAAFDLPSRYLWLDSSDTTNYYIDTETIKYQRTVDGRIDLDVIDVWLVYTYSDAERNKKVNRLIKNSMSPSLANQLAYEQLNFSYKVKRQEFYCKKVYYVGYEGNTIEEFDTKNGYISLVPGSIFETVWRKVGEYVKLHQAEVLDRS
jgi:hypothetical protein